MLNPYRYLLLAFLLCSFALPGLSATAANHDSAAKIARYFFESVGGKNTLISMMGARTANEAPQLRNMVTTAIDNHFDIDELARRTAVVIAEKLTPDDILEVNRFIDSADGQLLLETTRPYDNLDDMTRALAALPIDVQQRVEATMKSPALTRLLGVLASPEFATISRTYGEDVVCIYLSENDPDAYKAVQSLGKCIAP